jgi:hypothetical protein
VNLIDCVEDHRRGAVDCPAHKVIWAVAMMYLGEPLVDGYGLAVGCENWEHLIIGTQPDNVRDYQARRGREGGPPADQRGARGRTVAIRAAILAARGAGTSVEKALQQAINAGIPPHQERLF